MPSEYQSAIATAKKHRGLFYEALRLLLGEYFDDRRERLGAIRRLIETIWWIQDDSDESEKPLRVANARALLIEVEEAARILINRSERLAEMLEIIDLQDADVLTPLRLGYQKGIAGIAGATDDRTSNRSELVERLFALEENCQVIREQVLGHLSPSEYMPIVLISNAKLRLVIQSALIFGEYRPKDLKSTRPGRASSGGSFHRFCATLFEMIFECGADEAGVGLGRYVEFVAPRTRLLHGLLANRYTLECARPPEIYGERIVREIDRLDREIATLRREIDAGPFRQSPR